jgi:membrane protein
MGQRATDAEAEADAGTEAKADPEGGAEDVGRSATAPHEIPAKGWREVLLRVKDQAKQDRVSLLAGGVAFYAVLALVPSLIAVVSIYGLVGDPVQIQRHVRDLTGALPPEAQNLIVSQLKSIISSSGSGLSIAAVLAVLGALWSASSSMNHLVEAINAAYGEDEGRKFVRLRLLALGLTLAGVVFIVVAFALVVFLPAAAAKLSLPEPLRVVVSIVRFPVLGIGMIVGLGVLYRFAPDRDDARWQWVSWGAVLATVLWLVASILFSVYASNFGTYNETYGSLAAIIVLMLWLLITAAAVILGAELNAELESQTARDSTVGEERPLGQRGARAADVVGESP